MMIAVPYMVFMGAILFLAIGACWMALQHIEKQIAVVNRRIEHRKLEILRMSDALTKLTQTLTQTQATLAAITAANPSAPEDLSGAQALADANGQAVTALATQLGVTVPAPVDPTNPPAPAA